MFVSNIKTRYKRHRKKRFCQGDILGELSVSIGLSDSTKYLDILVPYAVILSQDCDLDKDYMFRSRKSEKTDKFIQAILICPAYPAEQFFLGKHIANEVREPVTSRVADKIKKNDELKRFHYLTGNQFLKFPNLVLDFKHFYTVPRNVLYSKRKEKYLATLNEVFREELSQRFSYFLSRIGTPEI